jgi:DNA-binding PadR family transcriptional regulator
MSKSNLLIDESPIVFQPTLAKLVGLHEAIVLQTLRYWCGNKKCGKVVEDERWIFNTLEQWREFSFPFWSARTIGELFRTLESMGLVKSKQFDLQDGKAMKYYTVTDAALNILTSAKADHVEDSSTPIWNFLPDHVEDSSRSARARHIKQYTEKQTEKQKPLTPLQGEVENSPEGSYSTNAELKLDCDTQGAIAQQTKSDDLCSRPPQHDKAQGLRGSRKSPPTKKQVLLADDAYFAKLAEIYPHLDMEKESKGMDAWLLSRPHRPKSQAFAANWINRAAERYAEKNPKPQKAPDEKTDPVAAGLYWKNLVNRD